MTNDEARMTKEARSATKREYASRTVSPLTPALSPLRGEGEPLDGSWPQRASTWSWRLPMKRNNGLLSLTLSSRGGEGEPSAVAGANGDFGVRASFVIGIPSFVI